VVRLEPRAAALREPGDCLPRPDGRPLSVNGRGAVGAPGLPLSGCTARSEPVAAAGQVVPRDPSLHRAVLPVHRDDRGGHRRLVRHPLHWPLPEVYIQLRRGRHPLVQPGGWLRVHSRHGPLPAIPTGRLRPSICKRQHKKLYKARDLGPGVFAGFEEAGVDEALAQGFVFEQAAFHGSGSHLVIRLVQSYEEVSRNRF